MRTSNKSMARRLVVWLTATLTCFWLAAAGLGAHVMQEEFGEIFDSALEETAARLLPIVVDDLFQRASDNGPLNFQQAVPLSEEEYLTYQVRDATGKVLMHSHDQARKPFNAPLRSGFWDGDGHRVYTLAAISNTIFVQVADPLSHRREALREGSAALLLPLFLLVPAACSWSGSSSAASWSRSTSCGRRSAARTAAISPTWKCTACRPNCSPSSPPSTAFWRACAPRSMRSANSPPTAPMNCARRLPGRSPRQKC